MSLKIGKHVASMLAADARVKGYVEGRIYPIVAPEGAVAPFVVFSNDGVQPEYTKDGVSSEAVAVSLTCVATNYAIAVDMAEAVREALDGKERTYGDFAVLSAEMTGSAEEWLQEVEAYAVTVRMEFVTEVNIDEVNIDEGI